MGNMEQHVCLPYEQCAAEPLFCEHQQDLILLSTAGRCPYFRVPNWMDQSQSNPDLGQFPLQDSCSQLMGIH